MKLKPILIVAIILLQSNICLAKNEATVSILPPSLTSFLNIGKEKFQEFGEDTLEKALEKAKDDMRTVQTALTESGYEITRIFFSVAPLPSSTFCVKRTAILSTTEKDRVYGRYKKNPIIRFALSSLEKAYQVKMKNFQVSSVRLTLALHPKITAVLEPK